MALMQDIWYELTQCSVRIEALLLYSKENVLLENIALVFMLCRVYKTTVQKKKSLLHPWGQFGWGFEPPYMCCKVHHSPWVMGTIWPSHSDWSQTPLNSHWVTYLKSVMVGRIQNEEKNASEMLVTNITMAWFAKICLGCSWFGLGVCVGLFQTPIE